MNMKEEDPVEIDQLMLQLFRRTGALLEGHFLLTSGLHSPRYLQCALVLQHPEHAEQAGRAIAAHFQGEGIGAVVSPAIGGIIIGRSACAQSSPSAKGGR
jgi:orotate phosphoribosyltransferase